MEFQGIKACQLVGSLCLSLVLAFRVEERRGPGGEFCSCLFLTGPDWADEKFMLTLMIFEPSALPSLNNKVLLLNFLPDSSWQ